MRQLYTPRERPMKVFPFFSGGASSVKAMLADPNYGTRYRIDGAFTERETKKNEKGRELCNSSGIEVVYIDKRNFYAEIGGLEESEIRGLFYEKVRAEIEKFEPDVITLCGYMHIVTEPLLSEYLVLNVHPADLSILSGPEVDRYDASTNYADFVKEFAAKYELERKFKGEDPVYDALVASESDLRSTVHIATTDFDEGPIVTQSRPFFVNVSRRDESMRSYADELQEKMKREGDGPAYIKALELLAEGRLAIEDDVLYLDGKPLYYCGYRIDR